MIKLEDIGFYTLSESRCAKADEKSPLWRCELILTGRCNFNCPYCRHVGGKDLPYEQAEKTVREWAAEGLKNIRFSGGEPTLYSGLEKLVALAKSLGVERIAISSNGSAKAEVYQTLIDAGVNDFSISLDACCAEDGDKMAGGVKGAWQKVIDNIKYVSARVYTTVGVVLTNANIKSVNGIIQFAHELGVHDIRIIPAAQDGDRLHEVEVDAELLAAHPILKYRIDNIKAGKPVRGLSEKDTTKCGLVLDDMAVMGNLHYPCIIYMREEGMPIGKVGPTMRGDRKRWYETHNTHEDTICRKNCLDVCVQYNNRHAKND